MTDKNDIDTRLATLDAALADWRGRAEALWRLLDDIDTASDVFKSNYEGLAKYVYAKQQERHQILKSDGYSVVHPDEAFRQRGQGNRMQSNASPAATQDRTEP